MKLVLKAKISLKGDTKVCLEEDASSGFEDIPVKEKMEKLKSKIAALSNEGAKKKEASGNLGSAEVLEDKQKEIKAAEKAAESVKKALEEIPDNNSQVHVVAYLSYLADI